MRISTVFLAGILLAGAAHVARGASGWEKVSDSDDIIVYQKDLSDSDTISLRAETVIDATVASVTAVMVASTGNAAWMPMITDRHELKTVSATERIEYTHVALPWPLTDRYYINSAKMLSLPNGVVRLSVKSVEHPDPAWLENDKILGELHVSEFILEPTANGQKTHMTFEVNTDPKGMVPSWLVNFAQLGWPRDFVAALKGQLEQRGLLAH